MSLQLPSRGVRTRASSDAELMGEWLRASSKSPHTLRAYRRIVSRFLAHLPVELQEAVPDEALAAMDAMCAAGRQRNGEEGVAKFSAKTYGAIVKSFLSYAHGRAWTEENLGARIEVSIKAKERAAQRRKRRVSQDDMAKVIKAANSRRDRVLIGLAYAGALRVAEIARLKWRDVLYEDGRVVLAVTGKGDDERLVRLDPVTSAALLKHRGETYDPNAPVFPSREGKNSGGHMAERTISVMMKRAAKRAGVALAATKDGRTTSSFSCHWARHAHASHALKRGQDIETVRETLGHSSVAVTQVYLHADDQATSADGLDPEVLRAIDED